MAAILRSGKFLRIVTGLTKSGATPASGQGNQKDGNGGFIAIPNLEAGGQHMPFHAWSLQNLQSALPVLASDSDKRLEEDENEEAIEKFQFERRGKHTLPVRYRKP